MTDLTHPPTPREPLPEGSPDLTQPTKPQPTAPVEPPETNE